MDRGAHNAAADRRWFQTIVMAQHTAPAVERDEKQNEGCLAGVRPVGHANDGMCLHNTALLETHETASRILTVTAAAVPPPLWVRPSRAFGTWLGCRPRSCIAIS